MWHKIDLVRWKLMFAPGFKADMWLNLRRTWRAVEAMHGQMDDQQMARRAGVVAFSLSSNRSMPASSHMRHNSAVTRVREDYISGAGPPQLPSLAEFTAGLPTYTTQLAGTVFARAASFAYPTRS